MRVPFTAIPQFLCIATSITGCSASQTASTPRPPERVPTLVPEPDSATRPWNEPVSNDEFELAIKSIHAQSDWTFTRPDPARPAYANIRLEVRPRSTSIQPFAVKSFEVDELRDEIGRDLRPARSNHDSSSNERAQLFFGNQTSPLGVSLDFKELRDIPGGIGILKGTMTVAVLDDIHSGEIPLIESPDWAPVPNLNGVSVLVSHLAQRLPNGQVQFYVKVPARSEGAFAGPPYVVRTRILDVDGGTTDSLTQGDSDLLVKGSAIARFQAFIRKEGVVGRRVRVTAALRERLITLPFEFRNIPIAATPSSAQVVRSVEAFPLFNRESPPKRDRRGIEQNGFFVRAAWVGASVDISSSPNRVAVERKATLNVAVEDLTNSRKFMAQPRLILSGLIDDLGNSLIDSIQTDQINDPLSAEYMRPTFNDYGNMTAIVSLRLTNTLRLPKRLRSLTGRLEVPLASEGTEVIIPSEPTDDLRPLQGFPTIRAHVRPNGPRDPKGSVVVEFVRETPDLPLKPARAGDRRPPFVSRIDFVRNGVVFASKSDPEEGFVDGAMRSSSAFGTINVEGAQLRFVVLAGEAPISIDFSYTDVPVTYFP